jgi:hypothetical protein
VDGTNSRRLPRVRSGHETIRPAAPSRDLAEAIIWARYSLFDTPSG